MSCLTGDHSDQVLRLNMLHETPFKYSKRTKDVLKMSCSTGDHSDQVLRLNILHETPFKHS